MIVIQSADIGSFGIQLKCFAVTQDGPAQSGILGGNGDDGFPVAAPRLQLSGPAAEAILSVAEAGEDGAGAHNQQAAQIGVARFGDAPQTGFAATAVLAGRQSEPGGDLPAIGKVMTNANAGQQGAGGGGADAGQLHQPAAAFVLPGVVADGAVVFGDTLIEPLSMGQQIANAAVDPGG